MKNIDTLISGISKEKDLTDFILQNAKDFLYSDWNLITHHRLFSDKIIDKIASVINWEFMCMFYMMNEKTISKYKNHMFWYHVSLFQNLSENFIKEHKNLLCLEPLTRNSLLSKNAKALANDLYDNHMSEKNRLYTNKELNKTMFYRDNKLSQVKASSTIDYNNIRKPELKKILSERGVSFNSGDPVSVLRKLCIESETK